MFLEIVVLLVSKACVIKQMNKFWILQIYFKLLGFIY